MLHFDENQLKAQPYIGTRTFGIESVVSGASTFGEQPEVQLIEWSLHSQMYDSYRVCFPVLSSDFEGVLMHLTCFSLGTNFGENVRGLPISYCQSQW